jgi:hypothetical protein
MPNNRVHAATNKPRRITYVRIPDRQKLLGAHARLGDGSTSWVRKAGVFNKLFFSRSVTGS